MKTITGQMRCSICGYYVPAEIYLSDRPLCAKRTTEQRELKAADNGWVKKLAAKKGTK